MSNTWEDRRGLFQKGRDVHEPSSPTKRRSSSSSGGSGGVMEAIRKSSVSSNDGLNKTMSNTSSASSPPPATGQRRKSSNAGLFGNLTNLKRGSEDYGERRTSLGDQQSGGIFSGWYNKTFKGMQGPGQPQGAQGTQGGQQQERRGVME